MKINNKQQKKWQDFLGRLRDYYEPKYNRKLSEEEVEKIAKV